MIIIGDGVMRIWMIRMRMVVVNIIGIWKNIGIGNGKIGMWVIEIWIINLKYWNRSYWNMNNWNYIYYL